MTLRAVIFDWGGTLSSYADVDMSDMWRMAARRMAPDREDEVCAALVAAEAASWDRIALDRRSTQLRSILEIASGQLRLNLADIALDEAATSHLDAWTPHVRHDGQAVDALRQLRSRGLRIGLLSNTHWPRSFHEHFLVRDGLAPLIDTRSYTSEMPYTKPHPSAFVSVLRALGVAATEAIFVGDRPFDDIHGAQSVGMRTILRPNAAVPDYEVHPDAVVNSLDEVVQVVDSWRGHERS